MVGNHNSSTSRTLHKYVFFFINRSLFQREGIVLNKRKKNLQRKHVQNQNRIEYSKS